MLCNLCGCTEFLDMRRRKLVLCKNCHSLERTRLLWLYIEKINILLSSYAAVKKNIDYIFYCP